MKLEIVFPTKPPLIFRPFVQTVHRPSATQLFPVIEFWLTCLTDPCCPLLILALRLALTEGFGLSANHCHCWCVYRYFFFSQSILHTQCNSTHASTVKPPFPTSTKFTCSRSEPASKPSFSQPRPHSSVLRTSLTPAITRPE